MLQCLPWHSQTCQGLVPSTESSALHSSRTCFSSQFLTIGSIFIAVRLMKEPAENPSTLCLLACERFLPRQVLSKAKDLLDSWQNLFHSQILNGPAVHSVIFMFKAQPLFEPRDVCRRLSPNARSRRVCFHSSSELTNAVIWLTTKRRSSI